MREPALVSKSAGWLLVGRRRRAILITVVLLVGVAGLAMRYWLLHVPFGRVDSDEATTGLMARGVIHGNFAAIVSGNNYGGTLEAYIYAPFYWLFGPNKWVFKSVVIAEWVVVGLVLSRVATRLWGRASGTVVALVVWAGGPWTLFLSTRFFLGYPSGVMCLGGFALFCVRLAQADRIDDATGRRLALFCGLFAGLAFWQHPLAIATVLTGMVGLWADLRRFSVRERGRLSVWIVAAGFVGTFPFVWYNVMNSFPSKTLPELPSSTLLGRIHTMFTQLIPRGLGLRDYGGAWVFGRITILLFAAALVALWVGAARLLRSHAAIGLAGLFGPFAMALFPSLYYTTDGHYYSFIMAPVLLCIVGCLPRSISWDVLRPVFVAGIAIVIAAATIRVGVRDFSRNLSDPDADIYQLADGLQAAGYKYVRADYGIAYRLTFLSNNRIVAASSLPQRFAYIDNEANASEQEAFVAMVGDAADITWPKVMNRRRFVIGAFAIYVPK